MNAAPIDSASTPASPTAPPSPAPLSSALRRFASIGLPELSAEADLQVRIDRKYLLPAGAAAAVMYELDPGAALVLQIGARRRFGYESLYFDTPALASYRATAQRRRRRFKVRTRRYLEAGGTFLEVKTHGPRGATIKHRLAYDAAPMNALTPTGLDFVSAVLDAEDVPDIPVEGLSPVLTTRYERSTALLPGTAAMPAARVTIDTGLSWAQLVGRRAGCGGELTVGRLAIIETKSPRGACAVDRLLWSHGHRPVAISKFGTGMAALHPYLPDNRWHRLLNRLDPAAHPTLQQIDDTDMNPEEQSCAAPF
jgi:hypothetical protein